MLKAHLDAVEAQLLATSKIPANTGHSLHKGTPREAFIKKFLEGHLSERVAVGTGEIIDCNSRPNPPSTAQRNQYDIVLYKRDYPKLDIGGGICAFLAESVVATIEVKSTLDRDELMKSIRAAHAAKLLTRNVVTSFTTGYQPPSILNYVVAYDGPSKMSTVHGWINPIHTSLEIISPALAIGETRSTQVSPSIDGVFVLGKGFLVFDNVPFGFVNDEFRQRFPVGIWQYSNVSSGSLLFFFLLLTVAISGISASWLKPFPYLTNFNIPNVDLGL
jgi:hypothetical protein